MAEKILSKKTIREFRAVVDCRLPIADLCDMAEKYRRIYRQRRRDARRRKSPFGQDEKYLSQEQWAQMIQYLEKSSSSRDKTTMEAVILTGETGLRVQTAINLKFEDTPVGHGRQAVYVRKDKNCDERWVVISKYLKNFIEKLSEKRGVKTGFVLLNEAGEKFGYQSLYQRLVGLGKKLGFRWPSKRGQTGLTPHKLRHTFGTHLNVAGGDNYFTERQLGHFQKSITSRYARTPAENAGVKMDSFHERLWQAYKQGFLLYAG